MAEKTLVLMSQVIALLQELKAELHEVRADVRALKLRPDAASKPRQMRAVITLPFTYEYDEPSIVLSVGDWSRIKAGETVNLTGKGLYPDGEFMGIDHWEFSGGIGGRVKLDVEFEGRRETEYDERLDAELIEELPQTPL